MPNYCENDLWVRGPRAERERLREFVRSQQERTTYDFTTRNSKGTGEFEEVIFDFHKILPRPEIYDTFGSPVRVEDAELSKKAFELYGSVDWYDWSINNWGTKWNASSPKVKETKTSLFYQFETAWAPPSPVIDELASKFPTLRFVLKYYECGMAFQGLREYRGGALVRESESEYNGRRGG
jgi:hypothetical protein